MLRSYTCRPALSRNELALEKRLSLRVLPVAGTVPRAGCRERFPGCAGRAGGILPVLQELTLGRGTAPANLSLAG